MFGFSRTQLILLFGAGLAAALSTSIQYAGARLAPPLELVHEAGKVRAAGEAGVIAAHEERAGSGPSVDRAASAGTASSAGNAGDAWGDAKPPSPAAAEARAAGGFTRDLNLMTYDDFLELPGVGPVIAQRIIEYRTARGRFDRVEQLLEIKGIGPATFAKLLPLVTVGPPAGPPGPGDETGEPAGVAL